MSAGAAHNQLDSTLGTSLGNLTTGAYDGFEGVYGGCDAKYGMGGFVAVLLLITAILMLYYVATFLADLKKSRENICGGKDEGCLCDGNETMFGGKGDVKWAPREVSEDILSQVGSGL